MKLAAYTLLELMLALALLGALLTVAWSLMGTYRDAEQRGWKLAHRTQTIRAAREWLQSDVLHLVQTESGAANAANMNAMKSRLSGNSLGFTATIAPSIAPVPFLERLMSNPMDDAAEAVDVEPIASLYSDTDAIVAEAQRALWPAETLEIEYQLAPLESGSAEDTTSMQQAIDLTDVQFALTRRELLDASAVSSQNRDTLPLANLAERTLTAQDLYRQTDSTALSHGVPVRETRLEGLTNVRFQYFDGQNWTSDWNSDQKGGLPRAIALSFDFPARGDMKPPERRAATRGELGDSADPLQSEDPTAKRTFADAALSAEPIAELASSGEKGLMQAATHEVQIVVYVGGKVSGAPTSPRATSGRARGAL